GRERDGLEPVPLAVALELELEISDERLGAAVAEPSLHLAEDHRVNMLLVPRAGADVEHDRHGITEPALKLVPRLAQLVLAIGGVPREPGLSEGCAVGQLDALVEGEAEQLRKTRLSGSVETRDPDRRQIGLAHVRSDRPQEPHVLLVDPAR